MKRRWKIGITLAVVGIASFLVWAFLSAPNTGVTIRFLGYQTNGVARLAPWMPKNSSEIEARFCLTNGSKSAIAFFSWGDSPTRSVETKIQGDWVGWPSASSQGFWLSENSVLLPGQSTRFTVQVADLEQPMRVTFFYRPRPAGNQTLVSSTNSLWGSAHTSFNGLKNRVSDWFRSHRAPTPVSITIHDR